MKRVLQKLSLLALLPVASLWGQSWCECGDWSVGVDLLVWSHTDNDFNYATRLSNLVSPVLNSPSDPNFMQGVGYTASPLVQARDADNSVEYVRVNYDPGVRVHGRYERVCSYVELSYLWLENKNSRVTVDPPKVIPGDPEQNLLATMLSPVFNANASLGEISGRIRSRYQDLNLEGGRIVSSGCWGSVSLYGNLRWVDIDHRRSSSAFVPFQSGTILPPGTPMAGGPDFTVDWDSKFWGVGLGFGVSGDLDLGCCLHAIGRMGIMGLVGEQQVALTGVSVQSDASVAVDLRPPRRTCFVPGIDVGIGLGYRCSLDCASLGVELVYDLHFYPHALSFRGGIDQPLGMGAQDVVGSIGYGGPSLRFIVGY